MSLKFIAAISSASIIIAMALVKIGHLGFINAFAVYFFFTSMLLLVRSTLTLTFYLPFALLAGVEMGYVFIFGERVSVGVLGSVNDTNTREFTEMFVDLLPKIPLALLCFAVLLSPFFFRFKHTKAGLLTLLISSVVIIQGIASSSFKKSTSTTQPGTLTAKLAQPLYSHFPLFLGSMSFLAISSYEHDQVFQKIDHEFPSEMLHEGVNQVNENTIIYVIGETSLPERYSLYGYEVNTTPFLQGLNQSGAYNFCHFERVHSAANLTRYAVPMLVSFNTPTDQNKIFNVKNLVELAKDAGYTTYWLSTQHDEGVNNNRIQFLASYADVLIEPSGLAPGELSHDIQLITHLDKVLSDEAEKRFIVLRLYGSHPKYQYRYTEEDKIALADASDYDRSIYHTDRVFEGITRLLEQHELEFSLLYTSDHGEIVGLGHGFISGGEKQYFVPLLYYSNTTNRCQSIEALRRPDGWLGTLTTRLVVAEMLGYQAKEDYRQRMINNTQVLQSNEQPTNFYNEFINPEDY